jgi:hypothetical protein
MADLPVRVVGSNMTYLGHSGTCWCLAFSSMHLGIQEIALSILKLRVEEEESCDFLLTFCQIAICCIVLELELDQFIHVKTR